MYKIGKVMQDVKSCVVLQVLRSLTDPLPLAC